MLPVACPSREKFLDTSLTRGEDHLNPLSQLERKAVEETNATRTSQSGFPATPPSQQVSSRSSSSSSLTSLSDHDSEPPYPAISQSQSATVSTHLSSSTTSSSSSSTSPPTPPVRSNPPLVTVERLPSWTARVNLLTRSRSPRRRRRRSNQSWTRHPS